jgi:hypothetical protein
MKGRFNNLDLQSLYDLLARQTELYTRALAKGYRDRLILYKESIDLLLEEINYRKGGNSTRKTIVWNSFPADSTHGSRRKA